MFRYYTLHRLSGLVSGFCDLVVDGHVEPTVLAIHVVGANTPAVRLCVRVSESDIFVLARPILFGDRSEDLQDVIPDLADDARLVDEDDLTVISLPRFLDRKLDKHRAIDIESPVQFPLTDAFAVVVHSDAFDCDLQFICHFIFPYDFRLNKCSFSCIPDELKYVFVYLHFHLLYLVRNR